MASLKPRKRGASLGLTELDADMQRAFSVKMKELKNRNQDVHEEDEDSGVVFLAHIPHGFYEPQMKKYFSQFGNVKRIRLSRSKKTGKSKGYAYIEFEYSEVAKVVADTMHNYLMYQKLLKCYYVPKDKLHPQTFKGCFRHFRKPVRREMANERVNSLLRSGKEHIMESQKRRVNGLLKKQKRLAELGIDFKIEGVDAEWDRLKASQPREPKTKPDTKKKTPVSQGKTSAKAKKPGRRARGRRGSSKKKAPKNQGPEQAVEPKQSKSNEADNPPKVKPVTDSTKAKEALTPVKKTNKKTKTTAKSAEVTSKTSKIAKSETPRRKSKRLAV